MELLTLRDQSAVETLTSKRNIHWIISNTLREELDDKLFDWTLFMASRFTAWHEEWSEAEPSEKHYKSKIERIKALTPWLQENGLDELLLSVLAAVLLSTKMGTQPCTFQQATGHLASKLPYVNPFDAAKTAAELLVIGASPDLIYQFERQGPGKMTLLRVLNRPKLIEAISPIVGWINNTGFNLPLVEPPLKVTNIRNCGYHTFNEPLILGKFTRHDYPVNFVPINILNGIQWVLDPEVLEEEDVVPKDFNYSGKQTKREFLRESKHVQNLLKGNPFWLAWQYDSRGRIYSHGYHVNFQSYEYRKAMLSFNKFEHLD